MIESSLSEDTEQIREVMQSTIPEGLLYTENGIMVSSYPMMGFFVISCIKRYKPFAVFFLTLYFQLLQQLFGFVELLIQNEWYCTCDFLRTYLTCASKKGTTQFCGVTWGVGKGGVPCYRKKTRKNGDLNWNAVWLQRGGNFPTWINGSV